MAAFDPTAGAAAAGGAAGKRKRVLCFGDSLTEGWCRGGRDFKPYASTLSAALNAQPSASTGSSPCEYEVLSFGCSGWDTVELLDLIQSEQGASILNGVDVCIIMAGTNDFADQRPAAEIVANLERIHNEAWKRQIRTVACTIPESKAATSIDWLRSLRNDTNGLIMSTFGADQITAHAGMTTCAVEVGSFVPWVDEARGSQPSPSRDGGAGAGRTGTEAGAEDEEEGESGAQEVLDWLDEPSFAASAASGAVDARLWEPDGLHLTEAGYEQFGALLAAELLRGGRL